MNTVVPGYMILLTLMLSAVGITAVTYIAHKAAVYQPLLDAAVRKEKASALALSGIQVALSQLSCHKIDPKVPADKAMLSLLLPILGRWQEFSLTKKKDGIDGSIKLCIVSEDGKFDLNAIYDFKKKKFLGQDEKEDDKNYRKIFEQLFLKVGSLIGAERLFPAFEAYLKKRDHPLTDVTELLTIQEFEPFKQSIFYEPGAEKKKCALLDLFTIWTGKTKLDAWLLSASMQQCVGTTKEDFKRPLDEVSIEKIVDAYTPQGEFGQMWEKIFTPLYGIPLASLSTYAKGVVDIKFGPTAFSVLSYGIVGKTIQKLLAIITLKKEPSSESDAAYSVVIKKLYWL